MVSNALRSVKSSTVMITALCDILILYAKTETYFTPNESYKKVIGDEIAIRKCDVKMNVSPTKKGGNEENK